MKTWCVRFLVMDVSTVNAVMLEGCCLSTLSVGIFSMPLEDVDPRFMYYSDFSDIKESAGPDAASFRSEEFYYR